MGKVFFSFLKCLNYSSLSLKFLSTLATQIWSSVFSSPCHASVVIKPSNALKLPDLRTARQLSAWHTVCIWFDRLCNCPGSDITSYYTIIPETGKAAAGTAWWGFISSPRGKTKHSALVTLQMACLMAYRRLSLVLFKITILSLLFSVEHLKWTLLTLRTQASHLSPELMQQEWTFKVEQSFSWTSNPVVLRQTHCRLGGGWKCISRCILFGRAEKSCLRPVLLANLYSN